jgi:hypothetical protein
MNNRYAITFGEVSILHVGGKEYGKIRNKGFSCEELQKINKDYPNETEYISISDSLPENRRSGNEAGVLVFRCKNKDEEDYKLPLSNKISNKLYEEQEKCQYDTKYWDNRRQKTLNKRARLNIMFGNEEQNHNEDYKIPTIISFNSLPHLSIIREQLSTILGEKSKNLNAEGNKYFHNKSGIGFHGDAERKTVICMSLGKSSKLRYQWRLPGSSEHTLEPVDINVNHGDVYIMSEKATGFDWKSRSKVRVVHAAGHSSYIDK